MKLIITFLFLCLSLFGAVGKITYIKGSAQLMRSGKESPAKVGLQLVEKDTIVTQDKSIVKLLFEDKSAISIGSKSEFSVEKYLFGEKENSEANFKMNKGVFRMITGKIAKMTPKKFKLKTKTVTIGIRGTIFSGTIRDGEEEFMCEKGGIYVESGGKKVDVDKGFKTLVVGGRAPAPATKYTKKDIQKLKSEVGGWQDKQCKK